MSWNQKHIIIHTYIHITASSLIHDGVTLEDALRLSKEAGVDGFEVRYELLSASLPAAELQAINEQLQQFPMRPTYSKPLPLFQNGQFEPAPVRQALAEARSFGCCRIKFSSIGVTPDEQEFAGLLELRALLQNEAADIVVTVENDQSMAGSDLTLWERFFARTTSLACPIKMTFDLGNWTCAGIDPLEAARKLGRYVEYMHVKLVARQNNQWVSVPVGPASIPHPVLAYLPANVPKAIEFPLMGKTDEELRRSLSTYIYFLAARWKICDRVTSGEDLPGGKQL